ncbi:hypothetical protein glysoja_013393 [Glycine soja]|nr:hypothetical protein glysoja_013393 [Glycine soja]
MSASSSRKVNKARQGIKVGGFVFGFQQAIRFRLVESTICNILAPYIRSWDEQVAQRKIHKPRWLEAFLKKTFFDSFCQYCVTLPPHRHHKILKIYRHVYKDVVSLTTMEKYIDSSQIQVKAVLSKLDDSVPPFISIQTPPPPPPLPPSQEKQEETPEPQKLRERKRKGIPHRAPFF